MPTKPPYIDMLCNTYLTEIQFVFQKLSFNPGLEWLSLCNLQTLMQDYFFH